MCFKLKKGIDFYFYYFLLALQAICNIKKVNFIQGRCLQCGFYSLMNLCLGSKNIEACSAYCSFDFVLFICHLKENDFWLF